MPRLLSRPLRNFCDRRAARRLTRHRPPLTGRCTALLLVGMFVAPADWAAPITVEVHAAFIRGLPPGQTVTAAFMTVRNNGTAAITLIGAQTTIARTVQMHETRTQGSMAGMRQRDSVTIPSHSVVTFAPGALHLMLIDLIRPLHDSERIDMTLKFKGAAPLRVPFTVRSVLSESVGHQ